MDRHLDLRIFLDPEFPTHQLMNALFSKLHRGLVNLNANDIGVSFPNVNEQAPHLGNVLRLHGTEEAFARLMAQPWLTGMRDHIEIGAVSELPTKTEHRRVRRVQAKSNVERIRRRQMKRQGWSEAEAREKIPSTIERKLSLPYLRLESQSTRHQFPLFLRHEPAEDKISGAFNTYGLSNSATVPWF